MKFLRALGGWFRRVFGKKPKPPVHWRLKLDGVRGYVSSVENGGHNIVVSGWNEGHWRWSVGDYLILCRDAGPDTRYQITKIKRYTDPEDQYFAECVFAPRGVA